MKRVFCFSKYSILLFFVALVANTSYAQQKQGQVYGSIMAHSGTDIQIIMGANIRIITEHKDTLGCISNSQGNYYSPKIPVGKAEITVSFIGYHTVKRTVEIIAGKTILADFSLTEESISLNEITIKGETPIVTQRKDTIIFNAAAVNTQEGDEAMKVLEQMPGVNIEQDMVSVMGKEISKTYINGRLIFGYNPLTALKNLPASEVVKIKVFDEFQFKSRKKKTRKGDKIRVLDIQTRNKLVDSKSGHFLASAGGNMGNSDEVSNNNFRGGIGATGNFYSEKFILTGNVFNNNINRHSNNINSVLSVDDPGDTYSKNTYADTYMEINKGEDDDNRFYLNASYSFDRTENTSAEQSQQLYFPTKDYQQRLYSDSLWSKTSTNAHHSKITLLYSKEKLGNFYISHYLAIRNNKAWSTQAIENTVDQTVTNKSLLHNNSSNRGHNLSEDLSYDNGIGHVQYSLSASVQSSKGEQEALRIDTLNTSLSELNIYIPGEQHQLNLNGKFRLDWHLDLEEMHFISFYYKPGYNKGNQQQIGWNLLDPIYPTVDETNTYSYYFKNYTHYAGVAYNKIFGTFNCNIDLQYQRTKLERDEQVLDSYYKTFNSPYISLAVMEMGMKRSFTLSYMAYSLLPNIEQLRPQINNANPYMLRSGNPNLKQAYVHNISFNLNRMYAKSGSTLGLQLLYETRSNMVAAKTTYFTKETPIAGLNYTAPANSSLISYENINGYQHLMTMANWQKQISSIKSAYTLKGQFDFERMPYFIDDQAVKTTTFSPLLVNKLLCNLTKNLRITLTSNTSMRYSRNNLQDNNRTFYQNAETAFLINRIIKRFYINTTYNFEFMKNSGINDDIYRNHQWNINIGCKLLKRKADLSFCAYDILNNHRSNSTKMYSNYVSTSHRPYFGRYFTVNFAYRFSKIKTDSNIYRPTSDGSTRIYMPTKE